MTLPRSSAVALVVALAAAVAPAALSAVPAALAASAAPPLWQQVVARRGTHGGNPASALDLRVTPALPTRGGNKVRVSVVTNATAPFTSPADTAFFEYNEPFKYRWTDKHLHSTSTSIYIKHCIPDPTPFPSTVAPAPRKCAPPRRGVFALFPFTGLLSHSLHLLRSTCIASSLHSRHRQSSTWNLARRPRSASMAPT